ncbi:hypothetical protein NL676_025910 [Syzygium grande]|nr:hypothetical protein NL676_025910 [Syzygium grande]
MANRDQPVNGRSSKLSLRKNGDLVLIDADRAVVWATSTGSPSQSSMKLLQLLDTGNLVLRDKQHVVSWQSFDSPTNTLLPDQKLTPDTPLVSYRSKNNVSSGYYRLYFDNDNLLRLLFSGPKIRSVYWPDPWLKSWDAGRTTYNDSRFAMLDPYGYFVSSDNLTFLTADYGTKIQRRLTVDHDAREEVAFVFRDMSGKTFMTGLKDANPDSTASVIAKSRPNSSSYHILIFTGFQYKFFNCYPKLLLLNGRYSPSVDGGIHFKLPKFNLSSYDVPKIEYATLQCTAKEIMLPRTFLKRQRSWAVKILLISAGAIAGLEAILVLMVWFFLYRTRPEKGRAHFDGYHAGLTGFRRFTYDELKKATRNFSEEIGRGSGGIVYKAVLSDCRVAAVKRLNEANQGENEFLAEVSTIGNLNHMNLIDMWGYCAQGKHRLLIYEFMEHGSLAENLSSPTELDWNKRSPTGEYEKIEASDVEENQTLTSWVREKKRLGVPLQTLIEEIVDPSVRGEDDIMKIEILIAVAFKCVEEDRDARPTMSQVAEMLLRCEEDV